MIHERYPKSSPKGINNDKSLTKLSVTFLRGRSINAKASVFL